MSLNSVGASMAAMVSLPLSPLQKKENPSDSSDLGFNNFDLNGGGNSATATGDASYSPAATLETPPSSNSSAATPDQGQAPDPSSLTGVSVYNALGKLQSLSSNAGRSVNLVA
jgi:hypothetical protein